MQAGKIKSEKTETVVDQEEKEQEENSGRTASLDL